MHFATLLPPIGFLCSRFLADSLSAYRGRVFHRLPYVCGDLIPLTKCCPGNLPTIFVQMAQCNMAATSSCNGPEFISGHNNLIFAFGVRTYLIGIEMDNDAVLAQSQALKIAVFRARPRQNPFVPQFPELFTRVCGTEATARALH
jgi:hypothetical protein